jgi:hypothetical protein
VLIIFCSFSSVSHARSGIIRVTPDLTELFAAHSSW